ncbi:MAG: DUF2914 domain-containing protein [Myxococcota bacterium]
MARTLLSLVGALILASVLSARATELELDGSHRGLTREEPASKPEAGPGAAEAPAEPAPAAESQPAGEASAPGPVVARAVLTTAVEAREPVDEIQTLSNDARKVFFFTEILDAEGQTLTHRWEHGGRVVAEVLLEIGSPRWRTYSSKALEPDWLGEWRVSVVDAAGRELAAASFVYEPAPQAPSASIEPSPPPAAVEP